MHKENICSVLREVANAASSNIVGFRMPKRQFMTSVGCSKYRPELPPRRNLPCSCRPYLPALLRVEDKLQFSKMYYVIVARWQSYSLTGFWFDPGEFLVSTQHNPPLSNDEVWKESFLLKAVVAFWHHRWNIEIVGVNGVNLEMWWNKLCTFRIVG